ncbi:MAG TPA: hypothetical protein VF092_11855 [Longimicrobium sp.]
MDFLHEYWAVIAANPEVFTVFAAIVISVSAAVTRAVMGGALDANKERLEAAKEEIARLHGQKDELLSRLEAHGEDINYLKRELAKRPPIIVSNRSPGPDDDAEDGTLWFTHGDDPDLLPKGENRLLLQSEIEAKEPNTQEN